MTTTKKVHVLASTSIAMSAALAAAGVKPPQPKVVKVEKPEDTSRQMTPEEMAEELSKRLSDLRNGVDTYNQFRKALNQGWKEFDVHGFLVASGNRKSATKVFRQLLAEAGLKSVPTRMPEEILREGEYESALLRFGEIKDAKEGSAEATEAAMLSVRIYEYEKKTGKSYTNEP